MPDARFSLLDDRGVFAVSGADRRGFLQGLVSNDVDKVGREQARYAALLTAQGKYLHDFIMIEFGEAIWLDARSRRGLSDLKAAAFDLSAAVKVDARRATRPRRGRGVRKRRTRGYGFLRDPGAARPFAAGVAFVDPRLAALGVRCILPRADIRCVLEAHRPPGGRLRRRMTACAFSSGFPMAAATSCSKSRFCSNRVSTN